MKTIRNQVNYPKNFTIINSSIEGLFSAAKKNKG